MIGKNLCGGENVFRSWCMGGVGGVGGVVEGVG